MRSPFRCRRGDRGQILVLFVFALILLIGISALVIDVGLVYATQRNERTVTDAAALAGAQQLVPAASRSVTAASQAGARTEAMKILVDQLDATSMPSCSGGPASYTSDVIRCPLPGTEYQASIQTPIPSTLCSGCDTQRAVLVSLTRIQLETTFARVMGRDGWDVSQASVAEVGVKGKYGVITLRPPKPNRSYSMDVNAEDLKIDGAGTQLYVANGDIGTNTSVSVTSGSLALDSGFVAFHYDTDWPSSLAALMNKELPTIIDDPNYSIPSRTGAAHFYTTTDGIDPDTAGCDHIIRHNVPDNYTVRGVVGGTRINTLDHTTVTCYRPGIYERAPAADIVLLEPGVYFMETSGWNPTSHATIIGGYQPSVPGVALVFANCGSPSCVVNLNNAELVALNGGTKFHDTTGTGREATAARTVGGTEVKTGPTSRPPNQPLTIMVRPELDAFGNPACRAYWDPVWPPDGSWRETSGCDDLHNNVTNMAGGGSLYLAGVTYAPSDNVTISGGSGGMGYVGQMVTWTLTISGGTHIMQLYPDGPDNGVLRLNDKCSGSTYIAACYP